MDTNENIKWEITLDTDYQDEVFHDLKQKSYDFDEQIINVYSEIGNLGNHWKGSDYDSFKNGCEGYKNALNDLSDSIKMYADQFEKISDGTTKLAQELFDLVEDMNFTK